jgi:tRNA pseudouridine38-40 synthase
MRYRAEVEYDGTGYYGFQRQLDQPTIQYELEQALTDLAGRDISIDFAGRTDTGVHALGQVIAFHLDWKHSANDLLRALNARLSGSISLKALVAERPDFHPRFDARRRVYDYNIYNAPVRSPYRRQYSWHVKRTLNLEMMNSAAQMIVGVHDFATFGQPPQGTVTVREVYEAEWRRIDSLLVFRVAANAFLQRMVRSLVGTMVAVGDGSWTLREFEEAFLARKREKAGQTAPAHGLFLMSVSYEADSLGE